MKLWTGLSEKLVLRASNADAKPPERIDLELLVIAKRTGLSFAELNELRVQDLLAYSNLYTNNETTSDAPRMATQRDIDQLLL